MVEKINEFNDLEGVCQARQSNARLAKVFGSGNDKKEWLIEEIETACTGGSRSKKHCEIRTDEGCVYSAD